MITPSFSLTATERVLPKLALDFTTANLDSRVTFTRTTDATHPATYVNSSGYVTSATNNQPRFDYDPVALTCKGLLIEESRTNALAYSEDFSNVLWTKLNCSVATNSVVAPDNNQTADTLTRSTGVTAFAGNSSGGGSSGTFTFSLFAKAATTGGALGMRIQGTYPNRGDVVFNLLNGTISSAAIASGTATNVSASISSFSNGWYRCSLTCTLADALTTLAFSPCTVGSSAVSFEVSSATASNVYLWGGQQEPGAFATSYIPTTTTTLTRNADVATMTGTNFSDWFNASEGTLYAEGNGADVVGIIYSLAEINDGAGANRFMIRKNGVSTQAYSIVSGTPVAIGGGAQAGNVKTALSYVSGSWSFARNATLLGNNVNASVPTVTQMQLGSSQGGANELLNGCLRKVMYYNLHLTNAELQAITKV